MAKDKSKKTETTSRFAKPSTGVGEGGNKWPIGKHNLDRLLIITPLRKAERPDNFNKGQMKKQIIADVVILNEKDVTKSEEVKDAEVEGGYVLGAIGGDRIGTETILGRLRRDHGNKVLGSTNEPWYLEDATDDDLALAESYFDKLNPFKADKSDDDAPAEKAEKKAKKKGKS